MEEQISYGDPMYNGKCSICGSLDCIDYACMNEKEQKPNQSNYPFTGDTIVDCVIDKFFERSMKGQVKYEKTLDRQDLELKDWILHSIEEKMDDLLYMYKILKELEK